jgi:hypothetical protein
MLYFFSSSHMRSGVVILVSSLEDVNTICSRGLSENGRFFEAQYLVSIPKKLTLSNCPLDLPNMLHICSTLPADVHEGIWLLSKI